MEDSIHRSICAAIFLLCTAAHAETVEISPGGNLRAAIDDLSPGDELVLAGGTYTMSSRFAVTVVGTAAEPIVIRAKTGESPLIHMNTANQNVIEVQGSRYVTFRGLKFTGGSHGIRLMDSDFVTIEDSEIYETGDVAISANSGGTYDGLIIRRNHIHHTNGTGEGMYLGCNNDACRVMNSLIEGNYIHHTNRSSVEQGDGIELKEGSAGNVIRNNVIHDTHYPGILTYSTVGNGPPNVIEGNLIWNTNDYGIQSAADAIIRNNILLGSSVGFQSHQSGSPSNLVFAHNTIVTSGHAVEVRNVTGSVVIANNAIYTQVGNAIRLVSGNTGLVTLAGNVGLGGTSGASGGYMNGGGLAADFMDANFSGAPPIDVFPRASGALVGAGSAAHVAEFDFNGTPRAGAADVGAYKFQSGGNPGWVLAPGFKGGGVVPQPPTNLTVQ